MKRLLNTRHLMLACLAFLTALVIAIPTGRADDRRGGHDRGRDRGHDRRHDDHNSHFGIRLNYNSGYYYAPPVVTQRWVSGYYATQVQRVLVREGYYETRYVPPVTETRYDQYGRPYHVELREGYNERFYVAPIYEDRTVQVWVPGYYVTESCAPPVYGGIRVSVGHRF